MAQILDGPISADLHVTDTYIQSITLPVNIPHTLPTGCPCQASAPQTINNISFDKIILPLLQSLPVIDNSW